MSNIKGDKTDVTIVVSKGIEKVKVPNVVGKSLSEAKAVLKASGLKISLKKVFSNDEKNSILKQKENGKVKKRIRDPSDREQRHKDAGKDGEQYVAIPVQRKKQVESRSLQIDKGDSYGSEKEIFYPCNGFLLGQIVSMFPVYAAQTAIFDSEFQKAGIVYEVKAFNDKQKEVQVVRGTTAKKWYASLRRSVIRE